MHYGRDKRNFTKCHVLLKTNSCCFSFCWRWTIVTYLSASNMATRLVQSKKSRWVLISVDTNHQSKGFQWVFYCLLSGLNLYTRSAVRWAISPGESVFNHGDIRSGWTVNHEMIHVQPEWACCSVGAQCWYAASVHSATCFSLLTGGWVCLQRWRRDGRGSGRKGGGKRDRSGNIPPSWGAGGWWEPQRPERQKRRGLEIGCRY